MDRATSAARRLALAAAVALASTACGPLGELPFQSPPAAPEGFTRMLATTGQVFMPAPAPPGVVTAEEVDRSAREVVRRAPGKPIYGVVTCTNPNGRCDDELGLAPSGEPFGVWVVDFPGVNGANGSPDRAWALFDPATGDFVVGDWP